MKSEIQINKHKNILIIGQASTKYKIKEIEFAINEKDVMEKYGDSKLTKAYKIIKNYGVEDIFLMNIIKKNDYLDIIELIRQNDFAYIVFTDLYISDSFRDLYNTELIHSYFAYILGKIGPHNESVFIVTDKHASLFENIDSFNDYMNSSVEIFKHRCTLRANLENIIVVANNLTTSMFANAHIAATLALTPVKDYPIALYPRAIFNIDRFDNPQDYAYFKNHANRETTIENLLNCKESGPEKIVTISKMMKYIKRTIDFSEFKGHLYNKHTKIEINKHLTSYLKQLKNNVIKDYKIDSIEVYKGIPGTLNILCRITVVPYNCLDSVSIDLGVEV